MNEIRGLLKYVDKISRGHGFGEFWYYRILWLVKEGVLRHPTYPSRPTKKTSTIVDPVDSRLTN